MLEEFAEWLVYGVLGLARETQLGAAAEFFIYDSIKVTLLLALTSFLVGMIRTYVTHDRVKKLLGGRGEGVGNIMAAILGIPTPFCSCSAVPLFIGFIEAGVPLGVTFSFLIACPLINEVALAMLLGLFGMNVAALYVASGLAIAVVAGIIIGRLNLEKEIEKSIRIKSVKRSAKGMNVGQRLDFAISQSKRITLGVLPYILFGIAVGAFIHGFLPENFLLSIAGKDNPFAVPVAVLIGIPLYSNAAGAVPVIEALVAKGMAMGTALALMMSIVGLSLPEMIILRKVLKPKLIAIFAIVLFIAFVVTGYVFNLVLG